MTSLIQNLFKGYQIKVKPVSWRNVFVDELLPLLESDWKPTYKGEDGKWHKCRPITPAYVVEKTSHFKEDRDYTFLISRMKDNVARYKITYNKAFNQSLKIK